MNPGDTLDAEALLRHGAWLAQLARALVAHDDEIDDVVQQTYAQALAAPPRHAANLRSWLGAIARNVIRAGRRSDEARAAREELAPRPPPPETPAELVARAELRRAVVDAVLALEEPYRSALLLRFFEEQDVTVIARITKAPEATVRTRIRRGVEQVRAALHARTAREGRDPETAHALLLARLCEFASGAGGGGAAGTGTAAGASTAADAGTATSGTAIAAGGIVMSIAAKLSLAGAAVVVATLSIWVASRPGGTPARSEVARSAFPPAPAVAAAESTPPPAVVRAPEPVAAEVSTPKSDDDAAAPATFVSGSVRGTVVDDASGEPVAGADVWIVPSHDPNSGIDDAARILGDALKDPKLALQRYRAAASATTADDGYFECDKLSSFSDWQAIAFDASGRCAGSKPFQFEEAQTTHDVELRLLPTFVLKGTVSDGDDAPLVGATVIVMIRKSKARAAVLSTETSASPSAGSWTTSPIVAESIDVTAQKRGYEELPKPRHVDLSPGPREVVLDFTLVRSTAVPVGGPIVDPAGSPIDLRQRLPELFGERNLEDAVRRHLSVRAIPGNPPVPAIGARDPTRSNSRDEALYGEVDADHDQYVVVLPPQFSGLLILVADSCVAGTARIEDRAKPPPLPFELSGVVTPPPWTTLVVGVVDAATGARVDLHPGEVGVHPSIPQMQGYELARQSTNPSGARVCEFNVRPGRVIVSVARKGFAPTSVEVIASEKETRRVVELELVKASASIRGHVTIDDVIVEGAAWKPAVHVSVYAASNSGFEAVTRAPVSVNDARRFEISGLAPREYVVVAESHGRPAAVARVRASESPTVIELAFTSGENVHFHVPRPTLTFGLNDVMWRILDADGIPVFNYLHAGSQRTVQAEEVQSTLSPGHYQIMVWARGCREATREFDVPAPGTIQVALERAR